MVDSKIIILFLALVIICNSMLFKFLGEWLIEWDPIEGTTQQDLNRKEE